MNIENAVVEGRVQFVIDKDRSNTGKRIAGFHAQERTIDTGTEHRRFKVHAVHIQRQLVLDTHRIGDKEIHGAVIQHRALQISVFIPFFRHIKAVSAVIIAERHLDFDPAGIVFINQADGDCDRRIVPASRDFRVQLIIWLQHRRIRGFRWDRGFFRLRCGFRCFLCAGSLGRRFFCGAGF